MKTRIAVAVLSFVTCGCHQKVLRDASLECETASTPLSLSNWTGPTEEEVLSDIAAFVPTRVVWDRATLGSTESSLSLVPVRTAEEARVEERIMPGGAGGGGCRPGPELVVPMTFAVDVDAGAVTGDVLGTFAIGLDDSTVFVNIDSLVELSEDWEALALPSFDDGTPIEPIDWRLSVAEQPWEAAELYIQSFGYDGHDDPARWGGHWFE